MLLTLGSFSIDMTGLIGYAEDLFNGLFPIFVPIIGIGLAFTLLLMIVNLFRKLKFG